MVFHIVYYIKDNIKILLCLNIAWWAFQLVLRYYWRLLVLKNLKGFMQQAFITIPRVQSFSNVDLHCERQLTTF